MKKILILSVVIFATFFFTACTPFETLTKQVDERFGKQHFGTAISLIELHKIRNGAYPESLDDLEYLGDWDPIALQSVSYKKLDDGYELNLTRGWANIPKELKFDEHFWDGLGLKKSNLK